MANAHPRLGLIFRFLPLPCSYPCSSTVLMVCPSKPHPPSLSQTCLSLASSSLLLFFSVNNPDGALFKAMHPLSQACLSLSSSSLVLPLSVNHPNGGSFPHLGLRLVFHFLLPCSYLLSTILMVCPSKLHLPHLRLIFCCIHVGASRLYCQPNVAGLIQPANNYDAIYTGCARGGRKDGRRIDYSDRTILWKLTNKQRF